jgi:hypothetical protein
LQAPFFELAVSFNGIFSSSASSFLIGEYLLFSLLGLEQVGASGLEQ